MRIVLTINDITITGGTERVVCNLANVFCKMGYEVSILSFYKANQSIPFEIDRNVKLCFKYTDSEAKVTDKPLPYALKKFYYRNIYKFLLSLWVWRHFKKSDVILVNDRVYIPYFKHNDTKYIKLIHRNFTQYHQRNTFFDTIAILSHKQLDIWKQAYKNTDIVVIPNFLPEIPSQVVEYASKIVISVGRMDEADEKGFFRLIDIWKLVMQDRSLSEWKLHIVGSGVLRESLESKIRDLGLQDCIVIKPFTQCINEEYLQASLYVMSSYFEGFPMVLLESAGCGLPAVAFDVATGPSDIIQEGKSGYLVEDNDLEGFANKLQILMKDENLRREFGGNAKQRIQEHFTQEPVLALWEKVIRA